MSLATATTRKHNKTQLSGGSGHGSGVLSRKLISSVDEEYSSGKGSLWLIFLLWSIADV